MESNRTSTTRVNYMGNCPICKTYLSPPFDGYCPVCDKQTIGKSRKEDTKKIIDTPWGKSEVIMESEAGKEPKIYMSKKRYEKLVGKTKTKQYEGERYLVFDRKRSVWFMREEKELKGQVGVDMTEKQILKKAIKKAIAGGYSLLGRYEVESRRGWLDGKYQEEPYIKEFKGDVYERELPWQVIIFSHAFNKAYYGDHIRNRIPGVGLREWQYQLQEMVLQKEPIKYLEKFL